MCTNGINTGPVSYTHLDVYKRQAMLTTVTLTTPAERVEPAGTTTELLLAARAVPTVQADTTPAIPIRAPTTGRHPLLSRRLVGILELRKRHRLRSMPLFNRLLNR